MITLTISTTSNPNTSGSQDHTIDLSSGAVLPQDIPLYAHAQDSSDPNATLYYSWHLLKKPVGSSAALSAINIQNPTLNNVDVWGDYRLFCIATNNSTNESSETDPVKAQNESFTQVRVRSVNRALIKPAAGERDWFTYAYEWVDALEDASLTLAVNSVDYTENLASKKIGLVGTSNEVEVTASTFSEGTNVTMGLPNQVTIQDLTVTNQLKDDASPYAYLTGKNDGWYMSDDGQASTECKLMTRCTVPSTTTSTRGGVILGGDRWSSQNSQGKIPTSHIFSFSQQAQHTIHTNDSTDSSIDVHDNGIDATQTGSTQVTNHCHVLFHNGTDGDISIEQIESCVLTGGDHQGQPYIFELVIFSTSSDLLSNNATNTGITVTHSQNGAWKPSVGSVTSSNIITVADNAYFGMRCTQAAKVVGHRYICNITAIRAL